MAKAKIKSDGRTITVRVPISIRKRGGRRVVLAPDGALTNGHNLVCQRVDNVMVKAISRAVRWREMLEKGAHTTIAEIATAEKINESYVARILRLTLLAPDIVESIVEGREPAEVTLAALMQPFPSTWEGQRTTFKLGIGG